MDEHPINKLGMVLIAVLVFVLVFNLILVLALVSVPVLALVQVVLYSVNSDTIGVSITVNTRHISPMKAFMRPSRSL